MTVPFSAASSTENNVSPGTQPSAIGEIIPDGPLVVAGEHAHCEWFFDWTKKNGEKRRVRGVDIFTFEGNKLKHKSAYLKQYAAAA
jgi:hypothetical protein